MSKATDSLDVEYLTEEQFHRHVEDQKFLVPIVFEQLVKLGISESTKMPVKFFFYTNSKRKADKLHAYFKKQFHFELDEVHKHGPEWAITGSLKSFAIEISELKKLVESMCWIGYGLDCEFDGFEVEVTP